MAHNLKRFLASFGLAYATYVSRTEIERTINSFKYAQVEAEPGFLEKERALDLKIRYKRNLKGNLETRLEGNNFSLPVFSNKEGIRLGNAEYSFNTFTEEEKETMCRPYVKTKQTEEKTKGFFGKIYELFGKDE